MDLRQYQIDIINSARQAVSSGKRKIIIHAPTGSGKTVIASEIIKSAISKGNNVLFLAHRRELIFQAKQRLKENGIDAGIIMSTEESNLALPVQIASIQTYIRRLQIEEKENPWFHNARLIVTDECHHSVAPSWKKVLDAYNNSTIVVGLTATPCRADGRGLGEYFDEIIPCIPTEELIDEGFLVPIIYYCPSAPDLLKIKITAGDYNKKELGKRVDKAKLIGDIYKNWVRVAADRKTIIFAVNVRHSLHIKEKFRLENVSVEHIDARTPDAERDDILERMKNGHIQVITNVGILTEGFDFPAASCLVLARPTKSLGLYLQMAGRGLRPFPGKKDMILLDHGGCLDEHGLVECERIWSLDGKKKAWKKKKKEKEEKKSRTCPACGLVFFDGAKCPDCGTIIKKKPKRIDFVDVDLVRIGGEVKYTMIAKAKFYGMLKQFVFERNYNPKMINARYRAMFGVWPNYRIKETPPLNPDSNFLGVMKYFNKQYLNSIKNKNRGIER